MAVEATDYLLHILEHAGSGTDLKTLSTRLSTEFDVSPEEAEEFLQTLIESQLLIPEIIPSVTGSEPTLGLIDCVSRARSLHETTSELRKTHELLTNADALGVGRPPSDYVQIAKNLGRLGVPADLPRLFQVDMFKPAVNLSLGKEVLADLGTGIALMAKLRNARMDDPQRQFMERFVDRYDQQEVPLVEVLDEETGIGFGSAGAFESPPLLEGLVFPLRPNHQAPWLPRHTYLLKRLTTALVQGSQVIELDHQDVEELSSPTAPPLPSTITVLAKVAAASAAEVERGNYRVKFDMAESPGARFFGRFCHGDSELSGLVEQFVRAEEALEPDAIFAEVVHLPEGRVGNIMLRPAMREYEIPYLGRASVSSDFRIPITDLLVSIRDGRILLRSHRLNKQVIPRLASAHNFNANSPTIYRFLCSLQVDGVGGEYGFPWGPLSTAPFLPRVVYGRLVVSLAQWRVQRSEWSSFGEIGTAAWYQSVMEWHQQRRLPRWVVLAEGDNTLPVDFLNILSLESFFHLIKNRSQIILEEMFPAPDELVMRGPEGSFVHDMMIPFIRETGPVAATPETEQPQAAGAAVFSQPRAFSPPRAFGPGSEWLYAKIYTGTVTSDHVLRQVIQPVVKAAMESGAADHWFFVRYGDPDWHLRVRFHGRPSALHSVVLPTLHHALTEFMEDGRVWRLQLDTYQPEVERYGGIEGVHLAEQLFWADSEAVLSIVEGLEGDSGEEIRWRMALSGIHTLLEDLGFELSVRHGLTRSWLRNFSNEFGMDGQLLDQMSDRFRSIRAELVQILNASSSSFTRTTRHSCC